MKCRQRYCAPACRFYAAGRNGAACWPAAIATGCVGSRRSSYPPELDSGHVYHLFPVLSTAETRPANTCDRRESRRWSTIRSRLRSSQRSPASNRRIARSPLGSAPTSFPFHSNPDPSGVRGARDRDGTIDASGGNRGAGALSRPMTSFAWLLLVAWLPGALALRWPSAGRDTRAALPAEERLFWAVVLSITWSMVVVLGLAFLGRYQFTRLLLANAIVCSATLLLWRGRLRYDRGAQPLSRHAVLPLALSLTGVLLYLPPSEYVIGGKDPGVSHQRRNSDCAARRHRDP